jgi:TonB family protein
MTDAPEEPAPSAPPAPPPARAAPEPPFPDWRQFPWKPILTVLIVAIVLGAGVFAWRALSGSGADQAAYVVQPYTPSTELITARDRVQAYAEPDTVSTVVVMFGPGVTLNVSGRVARGLGNDWYAITWNERTAFVRVADVVPGSGAPPAPIVREREEEEEEEDEDDKEKPDETEEEEEQVAELPPAPRGALGVGDVNWIREPSARDFARYFPDEALDAGRSGNVTLSCIIGGGGRLACSVASESPGGYGFGEAAIGISRQLRVRTTLPDGSSAEGREMQVPLSFRAG